MTSVSSVQSTGSTQSAELLKASQKTQQKEPPPPPPPQGAKSENLGNKVDVTV